jgi:hypothetical protein
MKKDKNNNFWYIFGGIVILFLIILVLYINRDSNPTCNSLYILMGDSCCLDSNSNNICDSDEYKCPDGNLVLNQDKCKKQYCDLIGKPSIELTCKNFSANTYNECVLKIIPFKDNSEGYVSYPLYFSVDRTNEKSRVIGNYNFPPNLPPGTVVSMDSLNENIFYFPGLIPDEISDMFIVVPFDYLNNKDCNELKTEIMFRQAKIIS